MIAGNIKSGGDLNPMVPGRKVAAIFGFCDIRCFTGGCRGGGWLTTPDSSTGIQHEWVTCAGMCAVPPANPIAPPCPHPPADTTEVLQEDVMEFVNSIAQIVHQEVGG